MTDKKIDIIIATHNSSEYIAKLLESIKQQSYRQYDCFVIDDNSKDDTVKTIRERFPWVKLIQRHKNNGPSKNRNIAIEFGNCPYIVILDDDAFLLDKDWLVKGIKIMEGDKNLGQVASLIVSGYDKDVLLDCGIQGEGPFFGGIFHRKNKNDVFDKHKVSRRVLGACTAGTILRRDVFERIGGFDPKYYYLCEDLDLSLRIHLSGYDVMYNPSLVTYHYESQTMGKRAKLKNYLLNRNCLLVLVENYPIKCIAKKIFVFVLETFVFPILSTLHVRGKKSTLFEIIENELKVFLFLIFNIPNIIIKRWRVNKYRKRPREYLIEINRHLCKEISVRLPVKSLIYLITNRCNAKCKMCFLYKDLNRNIPLLTLDQIRRIFQSLKELNNIVLSGGEPFLRNDMDQICYTLIKNNSNPSITIPTNGSLPEIVHKKTKKILGYGCRKLIISLSLDGMRKYHDKNRGIPELFNKVQQCYEKLISLKMIYGEKLEIQINTCITKENLNQIDSLFDYIVANMPKARWMFEPVRGSFNKDTTSALSKDDWEMLYQKTDKLNNKRPLSFDTLKNLYKYSITTLNRKKQVIPCYGGEEFILMDYSGNLSPCEILPPVLNIKDINYDINQLLASPKWNSVLNRIKEGKCYCTHFCWLVYSLAKYGKLVS